MTAATMTGYRTVIGLEVHTQLLTESKMFCRCSARYADAPPNSVVCPICLGMPGVLPVINRKAVELTILTGLALNCRVPDRAKFDRKNYAYPDLMKWYQISQYDLPFCVGGHLDIQVDGRAKRVGITRVHLEEDTAKMTHVPGAGGDDFTLIDVNRSGVPLMEVVSEPDMTTPDEAREYLVKLRNILVYLGVSTANMQEGAFRCDANISVWPEDEATGSSKVEVKNMNSFRAVQRALEFEQVRQVALWEAGGGPAEQETRGWVESSGSTVSQRTKEFAHDYRYFPEPDLPPVEVGREWVASIAARMPELPDRIEMRLVEGMGLRRDDALQLIDDPDLLRYFERAAQLFPDPQRVANWVLRDLVRDLNASGKKPAKSPVSPEGLVELLQLEDSGRISGRMTAEIFKKMFQSERSATELVAAAGEQISDEEALLAEVRAAIAANPQAMADYRAGKKQAAGFLVGQIMKGTKGRANPALVNELLARELS